MIYFDPQLFATLFVSISVGIGVGWFLKGKQKYARSASSLVSQNLFQKYEVGDLSESGDWKLALVIREDLKMGRGKIAAQCSHAAVMAIEKLRRSNEASYNYFENLGQPKIVLKIPDETALFQLSKKAREIGLPVSIVCDAGKTQVAPGSKTVIGVGPGPNDLVNQVTGHLKLY